MVLEAISECKNGFCILFVVPNMRFHFCEVADV